MNFKKVLAVALLGFSCTLLFAQKGIVKGTVTDEKTKEGIPFLNVYTADRSIGSATDFDGNYELELDPGTYDLVFSSLEYGKTTKTVTVAAGQTITLDVPLSTAEVKMETILVKTDKYAKPIEDVISSMEVLKPTIIENKASTDVTSALEQAPGLTIVDNEPQLRAGSGYSFGAGSRVMILVDDLPMLSGDAGRPSWGFIPIENIEQIEVVKGASSVLYGSAALNGVINVRTAYPTSTAKTVINMNSGVWDKPKMEEAKWWGSDIPFYTSMSFLQSKKTSELFSYTLGGNVYLERGFLGAARLATAEDLDTLWKHAADNFSPLRLKQDDSVETDKQYQRYVINHYDSLNNAYNDSLGKLTNELNPSSFTNRLRINFTTRVRAKNLKGFTWGINGNIMYSRSTSILIWDNDTTGLYRSSPGATTITKQPQFNFDPYIKYFDKRGNNFSLNTRIYYVNNDNDNNQQNSNTVYYGEFRYMKNVRKVPNFTISTGAMAQHVIGSSELFAGGNAGSVKRDQTNVALYAQFDKKFLDRINVTLGGRWEYFAEDTFSANQPIFRAGASARIAKASYVRASFGQGFRFPTISEKYISTSVGGYDIVPNPDLKPEKSWSAEVGFKQLYKIKKFFGYFDVAGFVNQYNNYIEFIANLWKVNNDYVLGFKSLNTGKTRVSGIDVSLLGGGNFTDDLKLNLLIGYTWARPVALEPNKPYAENATGSEVTYVSSSSDTSNYILKYRYEHLIKADVELTYKTFSTGFSYRFYSKMQNVDQIFLTLNIGNVAEFLARNDGPEHVLDWRISYQISESSKVSFVINNLLNNEYALRPLVMNAPRSYALQYNLTLNKPKK